MMTTLKDWILNCFAIGCAIVACSYPLLVIYALVAVVLGY